MALDCFKTIPLDGENYERLLPPSVIASRMGLSTRRRHLEDPRGRRYPALPSVAKRLLIRWKTIFLKERTISEYRWCDPDAVVEHVPVRSAQTAFEEHLRQGDQCVQAMVAARAPIEDFAKSVEETEQPSSDDWWLPKAAKQQDQPYAWDNPTPVPPKPDVRTRKAYYPDALDGIEDEQIAQKVYEAIKLYGGDALLSLSSARCLVDLYGAEVVNTTLGRMLAMHQIWELAPKFKGERRK